MLQPIIEGETAHFFEEIKVILKKLFSDLFSKGEVESHGVFDSLFECLFRKKKKIVLVCPLS